MLKKNQKVLRGILAMSLALSSVIYPLAPFAGSALTVNAAYEESNLSGSVERIYGSDRYETATKIAQKGWTGTSDYAILTAGMNDNLVDALAAAPLAKKKNAPILLTEGVTLNEYAEKELLRLKVKTVYVTTGVLQKEVFDRLTELNIQAVPLGGADRFETAVKIAKELGSAEKVVVTTGWQNADALSIASIAAAEGIPILLTNTEELPKVVQEFVDSVKSQVVQTFIIGGEGAVSQAIANGLPSALRMGGTNRYETNQEIIKGFATDLGYRQTYLANGQNEHLVDALVGSVLAAQTISPILLTSNEIVETTKEFAQRNLSPRYTVLGGEAVIAASVLSDLTSSVIFSEDGAVEGSENANEKKVISDNLVISGENVTLNNTELKYSVLIEGNNAKLNDVSVQGSLFLDPGAEGEVDLNNVSAENIVVLSGASQSIRLNNVKSNNLRISSRNPVRVVSSGDTLVQQTFVRAGAILDSIAGTLGTLHITRTLGQPTSVELRGNFREPVLVQGEAKVELSKTARVKELVTYSRTSLIMQQGAQVEHFNDKGNPVEVSGDGAKSLPPSSEKPPIPPVSSGGGGTSGGNTDDDTTVEVPEGTELKVSALGIEGVAGRVVVKPPVDLSGEINNVQVVSVDLQDLGDEKTLDKLTLEVSKSGTLEINFDENQVTQELSQGTNTVDLSELFTSDGLGSNLTIADLKAKSDNGIIVLTGEVSDEESLIVLKIRIGLEPFGFLHGKITDEKGDPIKGSMVLVTSSFDYVWDVTNSEGEYRIPLSIADEYMGFVIAQGFAKEEVASFELLIDTSSLEKNYTLESDTTSPQFSRGSVEDEYPYELVLEFNEEVILEDEQGFAVQVNEENVIIDYASYTDNSITLSTDREILPEDVVTVAYDGTGNFKDFAMNAVAGFSEQVIENNVIDLEPPTDIDASDEDNTVEGVDGRDFSVSWTPAVSASVVRQEIYILPEDTDFDYPNEFNPVEGFDENTTDSWTGSADLTTVSNGENFIEGNYTVYIVAIDAEGNAKWGYDSVEVKAGVLPKLFYISSVADNDTSVGVDGRDFTVNWTPSTSTDIIEQRIFILPADAYNEGATFNPYDEDGETLVAVKVFTGNVDNTWTGDLTLTTDSQGTALQAGDYNIFVSAFNELGAAWHRMTLTVVEEV